MRLEDVHYTGPNGAEQAIFLPVLKALTIFRAIQCVPNPAQMHLIKRDAKQVRTLFAGEPVPASEDIQQFDVSIRSYMQAAQLIGAPLESTGMFVLGLKDKALRGKLETAMDVMPG